jgi:translation initiation factor IF-1
MAKEKKDVISVDGIILDSLSNNTFKVEIASGHIILGHASGKMRMNYIRLLPGDKVTVELTPYDVTRGRIVLRHKKTVPDNNKF